MFATGNARERRPNDRRTRQRLVEAAAEMFVQHGFRNARVRDICRRARANVAAVNYHFGGKQRLYAAVLQHAYFSLPGTDSRSLLSDETRPEARLQTIIRLFLIQLLSGGRGTLYVKLIVREMFEPTRAMAGLVDKGFRPQTQALLDIARQLLGKRATDGRVRRCASSILGQCLYYHFARPAITRLDLERMERPDINGLTRHITDFTLGALQHLASPSAKPPGTLRARTPHQRFAKGETNHEL
ncbi:MAG: CerR family C-terminal domain-containing protein, partial [Phycisphaerae bacterium]